MSDIHLGDWSAGDAPRSISFCCEHGGYLVERSIRPVSGATCEVVLKYHTDVLTPEVYREVEVAVNVIAFAPKMLEILCEIDRATRTDNVVPEELLDRVQDVLLEVSERGQGGAK